MTINELVEKQTNAIDMTLFHLNERIKAGNMTATEKAYLDGYCTAMVHMREAVQQFKERPNGNGKIVTI